VLTGTGGGRTQTATFQLEIEAAPEKDFTMVVAPSSSTIEQGEQAAYVIVISPLAGFTSSVDLTISGLPTGVTGEFSPRTVAAGASSTLTIRVPRSTATGAYALTVVGTGGGKTHDTTVGLTVTKSTKLSILDMLMENTYLLVILLLVAVVVALLVVVLRRH
jgi:uncharacterized membrane protein